MKDGYNFDAINGTLTISASFAKKASCVGSQEYNTMLKLRRDFPNLTIRQEEKRAGKKNLTFGQMEAFINLHRNAKELKATFERVKKLARIQPMPYMFVKKWFEDKFPYYGNATIGADGYVVEKEEQQNEEAITNEVKSETPEVSMDNAA
ncbi:MAG: hypothetical protein IKH57_08290 [Clostridia bacterium]|nr:hypothetical protein [Clostridia bacterium]MBR6028387.1 hypothetical protein [Clostridia bacterium]